MKAYVLSDKIQEGLRTIEGYIQYNWEHNPNVEINKYFKLQYDSSVNDYDYSGSDITEDQEELLHDIIINNQYEMARDEINVYNYIKSALTIDDKYTTNKVKTINLNGNNIKTWINSKGFIHLTKQNIEAFTDGKKHLVETEYSFNKKNQLKEVGYNVIK